MIRLTDDGFQQCQPPGPEPGAELSEPGRLFPIDEGKVGRGRHGSLFDGCGHKAARGVDDGRHKRAPAAVVADDQMQKQILQQRRFRPGRCLLQPLTNQARRQLFMTTASGPSGSGARGIPSVTRQVRLGQPEVASKLPGIEPALEAAVCLTNVVQPAGTFHELDQVTRQTQTLRDRGSPNTDRLTVEVEMDGGGRKRHFVELVAYIRAFRPSG